MENEVKHERLLTETSRLSSSWANLSVSGLDKAESDCSSSPSSNSSPNHRPSSFSGPLVISVTCSSSSCSNIHSCCPVPPCSNRGAPTSPTPHFLSSGHASPISSPVSSRVQCYSPGLLTSTSSPTPRRSNPGNASPLLISTALSRKRGYTSSIVTVGGSSGDASREGSPDPFAHSRSRKTMRQSDGRAAFLCDTSHFRWPSGLPVASDPPSPSCHLFPSTANNCAETNSPSPSSLASPHLSVITISNNYYSPVPVNVSGLYLPLSESQQSSVDCAMENKLFTTSKNATSSSEKL